MVADAHGIAVRQLTRKGPKRNESRDVALYLARVHSHHKLAALGAHFGEISGAAASHACRRVESKMQSSRGFRKKVVDLPGLLQGERSRETKLRNPIASCTILAIQDVKDVKWQNLMGDPTEYSL